ncbi:MAG: hypothetical protein WCQ99_11460 [Pseudomonadota bacterium]
MPTQSQELENKIAQYELAVVKGNAARRSVGRAGLLMAAVLQTFFLIWLFGHGRDAVCLRICLPDTWDYVSAAQSILHEDRLPPGMYRSIGYPLFLTVPFWLGGEQYGYHLAIVMQSVLNLLGTLLFWKLLVAILPQIRTAVVMASAASSGASFGLALNVLSDFLFGVLMLVFLYASWLKRGPWWLAVSASALLAAGLTRITFGPFLLLLPLIKTLVQRRGHYLPTTSMGVYAVAIVISSGANFALENSRAEHCSESYKAFAMQVAVSEKGIATMAEIALRIEELIGRPYDQLNRHERDTVSRRVFIEYVLSHPVRFMSCIALNAMKYMLSPVDVVIKMAAADLEHNEAFARSPVRGIVLLLGLPIWVLALWPGLARRPETRDLYFFALIMTSYFIGFGSVFAGAGERLRFPALPMLLVCFTCSLERFVDWVNTRVIRHRHNGVS